MSENKQAFERQEILSKMVDLMKEYNETFDSPKTLIFTSYKNGGKNGESYRMRTI